ncbi:MAG: RecQ family ATP-dependent DNA helicase, partial [Bacteroidales bacterium]
MNQLLKKYFGYDSFRPGQEAIIHHILQGKDALVLMPTGGGKSVCFQIPALALNGTAVVISPLLSLMKDQVDTLRENGIVAYALNSMQGEDENKKIRQLCIEGKVKLLYISPEKLLSEMDWLLRQMTISIFAIDEAHCISQWGHDFRQEYTRLAQIKEKYPNTPIVALTATADKLTREDIISQLALNDPGVFISSFDRPNLSLRVVKGLNKKQKLQAIVDFIDRHPRQSGIIYCMSRQKTEDIARELEEY